MVRTHRAARHPERPPLTRRRLGKRWLRPALGVAFGLLLLYVAEVVARLANVAPAYVADQVGGWRMMSEMRAAKMDTREGASFVLSTNADGLRTSLPVQHGSRLRVALLGDSTVFGWGADEGGTVADGLQAALDADGGPPVEVLNAAQPGYTTTQAAVFFDRVVAKYRPDLVVQFLPMHDHNLVLVSDREYLGGASGPLSTVRVTLAQHSRLYQALRQAIFPLASEPFLLPGSESAEPRVPRVSDDERRDNLDGVRARLATWGGKLALGHVPFTGDLTSSTPPPRVGEDWAQAYASEHGLVIVDLRACCGPDGGGLVLEHDPGHLRAEGNLQAGAAGAAAVRAALGG